ncbi:uncharacterized protein LOC108628643 [Ceratina calcarata]|uniref:Uncharacterized protein LOC108628643 n=1 Tax=Ceratina calcarata TaxID=156304 RepID=A0AAJ7WDN1_9HYME|nr:uncharacterized protein LOC108628643 [Ceratina calcarata]
MACIWTPFDVLISTTLPTNICYTLRRLGMEDVAVTFLTNKSLTTVITYTAAITFLLLTLHVTGSVDYAIIRDCGATCFITHAQDRLLDRLQREFTFLKEGPKGCRCKLRRRRRSKSCR